VWGIHAVDVYFFVVAVENPYVKVKLICFSHELFRFIAAVSLVF
jgi:hypothetical protein